LDNDTNKLIEQRREKVKKIKDQGGNPYANDFVPTIKASEIHERFADKSAEELLEIDETFSLAGRMTALRDFGNMVFADLRDATMRIQLVASKKIIGPELLKEIKKKWDIGDIVGVTGKVVKTRTGELSIHIREARLLTKSLRPLPEKWHGLTDVETRYRQRYVDLIMNPDVKNVFISRSAIIRRIRQFFMERDFTEVETPMMHPIPGGALARPFETYHNTLEMPLFLRVAPELYLKRLLVGGFDRVFEINRSFRNEGMSVRHNPEFTMLEFYQAYATYTDHMVMVEKLIRDLAKTLHGKLSIPYGDAVIDYEKPFARMTMEEAVLKFNPGLKAEQLRDVPTLQAFAKELAIKTEPIWGWGKLLTEIYEETTEKQLIQPTYIYHHPTENSPLARKKEEDEEVTDRWELIVCGREIANAFSELNDPDDQRERFEKQMEAKAAGDHEAQPFDADYIRALEYGMPPAAGCGIGIDRLVMLLMDQASIRDVILFPHLRQET